MRVEAVFLYAYTAQEVYYWWEVVVLLNLVFRKNSAAIYMEWFLSDIWFSEFSDVEISNKLSQLHLWQVSGSRLVNFHKSLRIWEIILIFGPSCGFIVVIICHKVWKFSVRSVVELATCLVPTRTSWVQFQGWLKSSHHNISNIFCLVWW